ncbi:hypothetical protein [Polaromonas sp.]|uniref:hypothetical protein n=1 Tax=Polaromonas sp. TaxID=1869339 RepID=UPI0013B63A83|nr:hypothetical protein [Polaromonas sp.]NDP63514.1 hypothetical protein [Polaromonas sp.]
MNYKYAEKQIDKNWMFCIPLVIALGACGKSESPVILPLDEARLIEVVSLAQAESKKAENDMQTGGIKAKRDEALCRAITSLAVNNWIGTINKVNSNSDGKGVLEITISKDVKIKTWNNAFSDSRENTLIAQGSPLFEATSRLKSGQRVAFSGTFFKGSEGDCLRESSLTLRGKVQDPEFIFRFSEISAS